MKIKRLIISFTKPLDKRQEAVLIANFKAVIKNIDENLTKILKKFESKSFKAFELLPSNRLAIEHMKNRIKKIKENLTKWFRLYRKNEKTYVFEWQEEDLKLIKKKFEILSSLFKREINIEFGDLIKEKRIIEGLKRYVLPDMGLQPTDVSFEVLEIEQ